jgi:hypothetical protein
MHSITTSVVVYRHIRVTANDVFSKKVLMSAYSYCLAYAYAQALATKQIIVIVMLIAYSNVTNSAVHLYVAVRKDTVAMVIRVLKHVHRLVQHRLFIPR